MLHQPRHEQQHLVAYDVAVPVVDGLETVDVDHAHPERTGRLTPLMAVGLADVNGPLREFFHHRLEAFFERVPVEQAGQAVTLAGVQQAVIIGKHFEHAVDDAILDTGRNLVPLKHKAATHHARHHQGVGNQQALTLGARAAHAQPPGLLNDVAHRLGQGRKSIAQPVRRVLGAVRVQSPLRTHDAVHPHQGMMPHRPPLAIALETAEDGVGDAKDGSQGLEQAALKHMGVAYPGHRAQPLQQPVRVIIECIHRRRVSSAMSAIGAEGRETDAYPPYQLFVKF